jgi:type III restriction enzyme
LDKFQKIKTNYPIIYPINMPSFSLKTYQSQALDALGLFLRQAQTSSLEMAWAAAMKREGIAGVPYRSDDLEGTPCVCLRIPTGGGKTLLASHAIAKIASEWTQRAFPVALWLVPSETIRSQTLSALQTPGHAYRAALELAYGDALEICELDALHQIPASDFGRKAIVVVATIQSFRVANKAGRRVYANSETWETHFSALNLTPQEAAARGLACIAQTDIDADEGGILSSQNLGQIKLSLANWLAWQQPIVIIDEAHNAKTPLSLAMLQDIRPSCVLDLTATPVPKKTNVLYSVSARELEAEDMIKLPIMLAEHETGWQDAVRDALLRRTQLEGEAANESEYVRPIVLFQAQADRQQDKGQAITAEVLKAHLMTSHKIPEREIAVATGNQRELDGVNLFDPHCPVRYVITVDALKEGWDCSFAYVLCSLQNLRSNQTVEQLLGRVLRMPYAKRRTSPALNKAYAHVIAKNFSEAASSLVDSLTQGMGFDALSAAAVLLPDEGDLFGVTPSPVPKVATLDIELTGIDMAAAQAQLATQPDVLVTQTPEGAVRLQTTGIVNEALRATLVALAPKPQQAQVNALIEQNNAREVARLAPASRGILFVPIPQLCIRFDGQTEIELLERETLEDLLSFDLLTQDPRPVLDGFHLVQESDLFEIYVEGDRVRFKQGDAAQLSLDGVPGQASEDDVVRLIADQIKLKTLTQTQTQAYVARVVAHLVREQNFTLTGLIRAKFQLSLAVIRRIESLQRAAQAQGFQAMLFGTGQDKLTLAYSPAHNFQFERGHYPVRQPYSGKYQFTKHYFDQIDGLKSNGEEFDAAQLLDRLPIVKQWVRNLSQLPKFAFWLPTSTDYFYPDFVAELTDGRLFVVEYKGDAYATNDDSREKRLVGERWAQTTGQIFLMLEKQLNGLTMQQQLNSAIQVKI